MNAVSPSPAALLHLLVNGAKAVDVVEAAQATGLLDALDPGPVSLRELSVRLHAVPARLYKLLDCLESLGFVSREESGDDIGTAAYRLAPGVREAVRDVVGPGSIERDRDKFPWRQLHGRLPEVLRGEFSVPEQDFSWPPGNESQVEAFEESMAAGLGPVAEGFRTHAGRLWGGRVRRILDVGGGDGTLAAHLLDELPDVRVDVYNLPEVRRLVEVTANRRGHDSRLGFIAGDFLTQPLPTGYDGILFVRVLHDWPATTARRLVELAYAALPPHGRIVICEEFRNAERLARQFFWSYFLIGVDSCVSRLREIDDYYRLLSRVGFAEIEVLPGPFELITAVRPEPGGPARPAGHAKPDPARRAGASSAAPGAETGRDRAER